MSVRPHFSDVGDPLYLTPLLEAGDPDGAREAARVTDPLPGFEAGDWESYAGFVTVEAETDSHMFFWFFPATSEEADPEDAPVVVWLQGGPGSSSMFGLFEINGPIRAVEGGPDGVTGEANPYSWTNRANMLYIDNPVGTGRQEKAVLVYYTLHNIIYIVCLALHALCSLHTLQTLHYYIVYIKYITLHTLHYNTLHYTLYITIHYITHSTLHTLHYTLYITHFTLHTLHYTLYITHFTLQYITHLVSPLPPPPPPPQALATPTAASSPTRRAWASTSTSSSPSGSPSSTSFSRTTSSSSENHTPVSEVVGCIVHQTASCTAMPAQPVLLVCI